MKYNQKYFIDKKELIELQQSGFNNKQLAAHFKCREQTIGVFLKKHNLKATNKNRGVKLTPYQKQVLIGTLLGDSCIKMSSNANTSCLYYTHTIKNREYAEYKAKIFHNIIIPKGIIIRHSNNKLSKNDYVEFSSSRTTELSEWRKAFYTPKKIINKEYMEKWFTDVSLAFMFMDDGNKSKRTIVLNTQGFTDEDNYWLVKFFEKRFHLKFSVVLHKRKYKVLRLLTESSPRFITIVEKYLTPDMMYKLDGCRVKREKEFQKIKQFYDNYNLTLNNGI